MEICGGRNGQLVASGHGDEVQLTQPLDYGTYHLAILDDDGRKSARCLCWRRHERPINLLFFHRIKGLVR